MANTKNAKNQPKKPKVNTKGGKRVKRSRSFSFSFLDRLVSFIKNEQVQRTFGVILLFLGIYLVLAFTSYLIDWFGSSNDDIFSGLGIGRVITDTQLETNNWTGRLGARLANLFIKEGFGIGSFLILFIIFNAGLILFLKHRILPFGKSTRHALFLTIFLSLAFGYIFRTGKLSILGGITGFELAEWTRGLMGNAGAGVFLFFVLLIYLGISFQWKFLESRLFTKDKSAHSEENNGDQDDIGSSDNPASDGSDEEDLDETNLKSEETVSPEKSNTVIDLSEGLNAEEEEQVTDSSTDQIEFTIEERKSEEQHGDQSDHFTVDTPYDPKLELRDFKLPTLDLLDDRGDESSIMVHKDELDENKNKIIETLSNYSIQIDKIKATIGPTVTLYEIVPAPGVRISKIKNLEDDIALSLSALGIRIIAPMPGKGTIGIEVPNKNPEIVSMRTVLNSDKFRNTKYELPIGIGKTISNESYIADLAKMPHLLMAGATGQGKSVGLNAIITSLLYKKHPSQIKFILVDPKKVELTLFSKIERHYLAKLPDIEEAIITDTRDVVRTLHSLTIEMDHRYDLLKSAQVRNIKEYNDKFIQRKLVPTDGHAYLPYIVLVVDEFADLIMTAGKELEAPIARLAQLSRAVGIHLIIATQRPSVNIITGTIKANFPARIAFRVTSKIDSRTILDSSGADQLIGRGDMLLATGSDIIRLQCAFVDIHEVDKITDYIGSQRAYPSAFLLPEYEDEDNSGLKDIDPDDRDELFEDAARVIVQHQHGSTSLLQRKLKLGYNRAGRLIDQLEAAGIVGPFEGSKAREVMITDLNALEQFLKDNP